MGKQGFMPLAKVGKGKTLCATAAQDQYFIVQTNGRSTQVPVEKAVQLYIKASEKEANLVWKRKFKRSPKSMETIASEEENAEQWADKLRKSLGMPTKD